MASPGQSSDLDHRQVRVLVPDLLLMQQAEVFSTFKDHSRDKEHSKDYKVVSSLSLDVYKGKVGPANLSCAYETQEPSRGDHKRSLHQSSGMVPVVGPT